MSNVIRIKNSIINYLIIHIFLSLIALPILVAWGLPSSWLSPLGNLIFSPLLSIFLLVSSLAFFSELIGLPHAPFDWLLEKLTIFWHWLLKLAPHNALYGFSSPPCWLLVCIALAAFILLMQPFMRPPTRRLIGLTLMLSISMTILRASDPSSFHATMPCNCGTITIIRANNQTIVIDPGFIGSRISAPSWIAYTFVPELTAKTGSLTIDHLILLKPGILTFDAIDTLIAHAQVNHIYLPFMKGELAGSLKRSFGKLYAHLKQQNIAITQLTDKKIESRLHPHAQMQVESQGSKTYQTITYPHLLVTLEVDGQKISVAGR